MRLLTMFTTAFLVSGCVGPLVPLHEDTSNINIPVYDTRESAPEHTLLSEIEGYSCKNKAWDASPSREEALRQLKIKALKLKADGILGVAFYEEGLSIDKNCWSSITAEGRAIVFTAGN